MITTLTGKNSYALQAELTDIRRKYLADNGDDSVIELDGEQASIEDVRASVMNQGLFSSTSLVVLRHVAGNKQLQEDLVDLIDNVPSEVHLVIADDQFDKRTSAFKALKKKTEFRDFSELNEQALAEWAVERIKNKYDRELKRDVALYLVQRVNNDQWLLANELDKLANVSSDITRAVIDEHVEESFRDSVFNLLDAAFAGKQDEALSTYRDMLANKIDAYYVFSMLVWQLHILAVVTYSGHRGRDEIAKDHGISPFVVGKTQNIARRVKPSDVSTIIDAAADIDMRSKSQAGYDMEVAVETLIIRISEG